MTARPNAWRIGLFALIGLVVLGAAVVSVFGGQLFAESERAVLHFRQSIYGLQVGAPVVFRGVRLGTVASIGLVADEITATATPVPGAKPLGGFRIPVTVELDRALVRNLAGADAKAPSFIASLVERGLSGELATQSLLTGLLYVDLDLRPGVAMNAATAARAGAAVEPVEIPTTVTRLQTLQDQLAALDVAQLAKDVSQVASSTRRFADSAELRQTLANLAQTAASLRQLSATLAQRAGPLADGAERTLAQAGQAADRVGGAAQEAGTAARNAGASAREIGVQASGAVARLGRTLDGVDAAVGHADELVRPGSSLRQQVERAADELAQAAAGLRAATAADAPLVQSSERALGDVSRAARALRELADTLAQQPESVLRGRAP